LNADLISVTRVFNDFVVLNVQPDGIFFYSDALGPRRTAGQKATNGDMSLSSTDFERGRT
jgi:hypothetical protein